MKDSAETIRRILAAASANDDQLLRRLLDDLDLALGAFESLPSDLFTDMIGLLEVPAFMNLSSAWGLLTAIGSNFDLLTNEQREQLRTVLVDHFDRFADSTGAYVAGEMLGVRYGDEQALDALLRLSRTVIFPALALVPHSLQAFAKSTVDSRLRDRAVQRLRELASSGDEEVRREATVALGKLGKPS